MPDTISIFYVLLFVVAFLYASVGHGGASGYLALMAIFSMSPDVMKPTALLLNLFVSVIAFIQFYRVGHFSWKLFLPLAIASVPMAFLGGLIEVDSVVYKKLLGVLLLIPIVRFLFFRNITQTDIRKPDTRLAIGIGAFIGFLSGLIGIGGGIVLAPVLLLLKWSDMKKTAGISAAFIFVNSLSGLAGQFTKGIQFSPEMYSMVAVAFVGGLLGAYFGSVRFAHVALKNLLAVVLIVAAWKLLFTTA